MALFIIGAGATRGCSFVDARKHACIPPLDSDFYTQLQRIQNPKYYDLVDRVLKNTIRLFGNNFTATLETTFTAIEHLSLNINELGTEFEFKKVDVEKMRIDLLQAIFAVMEDSLTITNSDGSSSHDANHCEYHQRLVSDILKTRDQVISFNYDCTLDYALKFYGNGKWNAQFGYVINSKSTRENFKGFEYWNPEIPCDRMDTIKYHKLHGSLNFKKEKSGGKYEQNDYIRLKQRPYTKQKGNVHFEIIPPEWNKKYSEGFFKNIWTSAAHAIHQSKEIVIIGYSMPLTDSHAIALLNTAIASSRIHSLVVVNPDQSARQRTRSILQRGITNETKILSFDTLGDFVACKRKVWDKNSRD